jgi:hypothetical protein
MPITDSIVVVRPGQTNNTGAIDAQFMTEQSGILREQFNRTAVIEPLFNILRKPGSNTVQSHASGKSTVQARVVDGKVIDGTVHPWGKMTLTIAGRVFARETVDPEEMEQSPYDVRSSLARQQAEAMSQVSDQAFCIAAIKAGTATTNAYGLAANKGLDPATQVTLATAGAATDAAALYVAIVDLLTGMAQKDVDPGMHGVRLIVSPATLGVLRMHDYLINSDYKTSDGAMVSGMVLNAAAFGGVPLIASNNFPGGKVITGHPLTNSYNSYDGDFTKVVAVAVSPKSLIAGEVGSLTGKVWFDDARHLWMVDAFRCFDVKPDMVSTSGAILLP